MSVLAQAASAPFWEQNPEVVGASAVVAGAVVGALVGYVLRGRQWRRERRHETYAGFLRAQRDYEDAVRELWSALLSGKPRDEIQLRVPAVDAQRRALDQAYAEVGLIAGLATFRAADAIYDMGQDVENTIMRSVVAGAPADIDGAAMNRAMRRAVARFVLEGGKDIGNRGRRRARWRLVAPVEPVELPPPSPSAHR